MSFPWFLNKLYSISKVPPFDLANACFELYKIETKKLKALFQDDIEIANWGRRYAEKELMKTEEVFISRQFNPYAKNRLWSIGA